MSLKNVYITHTNCITPLGFDVATNVQAVAGGVTGISHQQDSNLLPEAFYASVIDTAALNSAFAALSKAEHTRLEKMMILALQPVIAASGVALNDRTVLILSTTKGNITALKSNEPLPDGAYLQGLAKNVANFFGFAAEPIVVSNACVSSIMAVSVAKRLVQSGLYDNVFIIGGDEVSEFVVSGFNSFKAMSPVPCKPYSANREGVTLGEAAAAALVTISNHNAKAVIVGDSSINDANHISGPSRTGEGLYRSIGSALQEAGVTASQIDYISAHGTATPFNDEMEAIAFNRHNLENVPVNSFKGYYGHTLGASGLLETVIGLESMAQGKVFASLGYDEPGVSQPINVVSKNKDREINYMLKTASGFGGCNTAVVFQKIK